MPRTALQGAVDGATTWASLVMSRLVGTMGVASSELVQSWASSANRRLFMPIIAVVLSRVISVQSASLSCTGDVVLLSLEDDTSTRWLQVVIWIVSPRPDAQPRLVTGEPSGVRGARVRTVLLCALCFVLLWLRHKQHFHPSACACFHQPHTHTHTHTHTLPG